jgi:hypothetical protein
MFSMAKNEQPLKQDEVQKMLSTLTKPKHDPTLGMAKPYTHAPLAPSPAKPKPASTTPSNTNLLEDANNALSDIRTLAGVK